MKFMWFHLMPYKELEENFRENNSGVSVDVDIRHFNAAKAHRMYNEFIDEMEYAASLGFDAICVNEHHQQAYGMMPSPNLIASALARSTSDAAICVMGNSLALYNPPVRVAEEMAMIDCISGGRLIAGFPVGTPMDTVWAYSQDPSKLRERYFEAHDLIIRAWTEKEPFAFNGRFNQMRYVNPWPRPLQARPPIWVPGGGSAETWHWCAESDYVFCHLSYSGHKKARITMDAFWAEMERLGKEKNPYQASFLQFIGVAESRQQALDLYAEAGEYLYGTCLYHDPRFASAPGYLTEESQRLGYKSQVQANAARQASVSKMNIETILDNGYMVIGTPEEVTEQLMQAAKDLHVGHMMTLLQYGNLNTESTRYNTKLFAEKVMPKLRPLFSEWEDHWWPKPLDRAHRAVPLAAE